MELRLLSSLHFWLFIATFFSTTFAGANLIKQFDAKASVGLFSGLPYSLSIMLILAFHEAGHYFAARWWGMKKITPPMFIPMPFFPLGTMGAVINIKDTFPNRRVLFDVGAAGPWIGLLATAGLWQLTGLVSSPYVLFQINFAVTVGIIVTFINLLPLGCLDGGHIFYAVAGKKHKWFKYWVFAATLFYIFTIQKTFEPWVLLIFVVLFGLRHAPTENDDTPLDRPRQVASWLTLLMFLGLDLFGKSLEELF